jgi:hypothetical protein
MNHRAAFRQHWLTATEIVDFLGCFYCFAFRARESKLSLYQNVALFGLFISMIVIFLAQTIFVVDLTFAVVHFQIVNAGDQLLFFRTLRFEQIPEFAYRSSKAATVPFVSARRLPKLHCAVCSPLVWTRLPTTGRCRGNRADARAPRVCLDRSGL